MQYPIKKKIKIYRGNSLKKFLLKASYIAKNVIYIKNFSSNKVLKTSNKDPVLLAYPEKIDIDFKADEFRVLVIKSDNSLIRNAQKLRYQNFFNDKKTNKKVSKIESDEFDKFCDHLLVIDTSISESYVVGTYRLLLNTPLSSKSELYTSTEFDLEKLKKQKVRILEAGRSCVHPNYRDGRIIRLLWKGLASYIKLKKVDFIIGCASFSGMKVKNFRTELSYLHYYHLAPKKYDSIPIADKKVTFRLKEKKKINKLSSFKLLPPLIKAYLRVGAWVGSGAVLDKKFKTIDVCIILKSKNILNKYLNLAVKN